MQPCIPQRRDSFWTSMFFLYILTLFTIPLVFFIYWSGIDGFIASLGFHFWQAPSLQDIFVYLSIAGEAGTQIALCLIVASIYYIRGCKEWARLWLYSIVIFLGAGIIGYIIKTVLGRPRPKLYKEFYDFQWIEFSARMHSLPSGHTLTTFALFACLFPFYNTKTRLILFITASLIGLGRVGITSHYLSDVFAGALLGYVVATLWIKKKQLGVCPAPPKDGIERFFEHHTHTLKEAFKKTYQKYKRKT